MDVYKVFTLMHFAICIEFLSVSHNSNFDIWDKTHEMFLTWS